MEALCSGVFALIVPVGDAHPEVAFHVWQRLCLFVLAVPSRDSRPCAVVLGVGMRVGVDSPSTRFEGVHVSGCRHECDSRDTFMLADQQRWMRYRCFFGRKLAQLRLHVHYMACCLSVQLGFALNLDSKSAFAVKYLL